MAGYKALVVPMESFLALHRVGTDRWRVTHNPLPKDANVTAMRVNKETNDLEFCIFSETYDWIKPGLPIPFVPTILYEEVP
jgi:hypothetical protein